MCPSSTSAPSDRGPPPRSGGGTPDAPPGWSRARVRRLPRGSVPAGSGDREGRRIPVQSPQKQGQLEPESAVRLVHRPVQPVFRLGDAVLERRVVDVQLGGRGPQTRPEGDRVQRARGPGSRRDGALQGADVGHGTVCRTGRLGEQDESAELVRVHRARARVLIGTPAVKRRAVRAAAYEAGSSGTGTVGPTPARRPSASGARAPAAGPASTRGPSSAVTTTRAAVTSRRPSRTAA